MANITTFNQLFEPTEEMWHISRNVAESDETLANAVARAMSHNSKNFPNLTNELMAVLEGDNSDQHIACFRLFLTTLIGETSQIKSGKESEQHELLFGNDLREAAAKASKALQVAAEKYPESVSQLFGLINDTNDLLLSCSYLTFYKEFVVSVLKTCLNENVGETMSEEINVCQAIAGDNKKLSRIIAKILNDLADMFPTITKIAVTLLNKQLSQNRNFCQLFFNSILTNVEKIKIEKDLFAESIFEDDDHVKAVSFGFNSISETFPHLYSQLLNLLKEPDAVALVQFFRFLIESVLEAYHPKKDKQTFTPFLIKAGETKSNLNNYSKDISHLVVMFESAISKHVFKKLDFSYSINNCETKVEERRFSKQKTENKSKEKLSLELALIEKTLNDVIIKQAKDFSKQLQTNDFNQKVTADVAFKENCEKLLITMLENFEAKSIGENEKQTNSSQDLDTCTSEEAEEGESPSRQMWTVSKKIAKNKKLANALAWAFLTESTPFPEITNQLLNFLSNDNSIRYQNFCLFLLSSLLNQKHKDTGELLPLCQEIFENEDLSRKAACVFYSAFKKFPEIKNDLMSLINGEDSSQYRSFFKNLVISLNISFAEKVSKEDKGNETELIEVVKHLLNQICNEDANEDLNVIKNIVDDEVLSNVMTLVYFFTINNFPELKQVLTFIKNSESIENYKIFFQLVLQAILENKKRSTNRKMYQISKAIIGENDKTWKLAGALYTAFTQMPELTNEIIDLLTKNENAVRNRSLCRTLLHYFLYCTDNKCRIKNERAIDIFTKPRLIQIKGELRYLRHLGQGAEGTVDAYLDLLSGKHFAIKQIQCPRLSRAELEKHVRQQMNVYNREAEVTARLDVKELFTECVSTFIAHDEINGSSYCIQMPLCEMTIDQFVSEWPKHVFGVWFITLLMQEVFEAVDVIHKNHFLHRDLKASNVLVSFQGTQSMVKVGDFGFAKKLRKEDCSAESGFAYRLTDPEQLPGTSLYRAPDLDYHEKFTPKDDVYCLGMLYYELVLLFLLHSPAKKTIIEFIEVIKSSGGIYHFYPNFMRGKITIEEGLNYLEMFLQELIAEDVEKRSSLDSTVQNHTYFPVYFSFINEVKVDINILELLNWHNLNFLTQILKTNKSLIEYYNRIYSSGSAYGEKKLLKVKSTFIYSEKEKEIVKKLDKLLLDSGSKEVNYRKFWNLFS